MALTLDPTLAAAQNSQSRHPLVEIISSEFAEDIPFDGQLLTGETTNEQGPNTIVHSTGRLITVYKFGTNQIKYVYTDTSRTSFSFVTLDTSGTLQEVAVCELADGNVGILYRDVSSGTHYFRYRTVTPTGTLIASGDIANFSASPTLSGPALIRLADDSYLMVYIRVMDGDYTFYKMTSSNFTSWGSASVVSVGGLTLTNEIENPYLHQITTGDIFLWFDYANVENSSNIYYSISADGGATWGNAVQATSYTTSSARAKHPVSAQKIAGQFYLFFNEQRSSLSINHLTEGWCFEGAARGLDLTFNPTSRKLYAKAGQGDYGAVSGGFYCVTEIDVDTWTISACWSTESTPAFPLGLIGGLHNDQGDGSLIPVGNYGDSSADALISLLDAEADTITNYCFHDYMVYGYVKNVEHSLPDNSTILATQVDATARRLYLMWDYDGNCRVQIGYIDLTEPGPIYHYVEIVPPTMLGTVAVTAWQRYGFKVYPAEDYILIWNECAIFVPDNSALTICVLSTGAVHKHYQWSEVFPAFPWHGLKWAHLVGNKIYGTFTYEPLYGQQDKRGLCEIDILTDTVRYLRPTWDTLDEYHLYDIHSISDGRLIISTIGLGITVFNPSDETWEIFNNTTLPGMDPGGNPAQSWVALAYDETEGIIFAGTGNNTGSSFAGVIAFSINGFIKQALYRVATYSGGAWSFGAVNDAVTGYQDYDLAAVFGPEATDGLFVFWTHMVGSEYSLMWDKEGLILNLNAYLAKGKEISIRRSIDGRPNELKFTVSDGHLFDPDNLASLLSPILEKGRKITVRFGEKISGEDYWANQGTFTLSEVRLRYGRGSYPEMEVTASDRRLTWDHGQILATPHYDSGDPEDVLTDILTDFLGFTVAEIDIPAFDNSAPITHQWMECLPKDIVFQVCNRFGYFPRITVDDKFSARKISNANAVDHVYSDNTKLIDFTPDDSFSDFTNQIIVVGQEQTETEIVYEEERIETIHGTIGWWSRKKDYTIYYSKDMSRRCRNPRLVVLESATTAIFHLGGDAVEAITYVDPNELYCVVTVWSPELAIWALIVAVPATIIANYLTGDAVGKYWTRPVGTLIQMVGIQIAISVLSCVANFQYEIWARPLGKVKRSLQGVWNDEALQTKIQAVVLQKIEEPLCNSVPDCTAMANQEGLEVQLQRRRRQFSKIAHLQDEEGDTLQIPHPYTGQALKLFVTDLTRKMLIPARESDEGYFVDAIEGWRL